MPVRIVIPMITSFVVIVPRAIATRSAILTVIAVPSVAVFLPIDADQAVRRTVTMLILPNIAAKSVIMLTNLIPVIAGHPANSQKGIICILGSPLA